MWLVLRLGLESLTECIKPWDVSGVLHVVVLIGWWRGVPSSYVIRYYMKNVDDT